MRQRFLTSSQVSAWTTGALAIPSRGASVFPLDTVDNRGLFYYLGTNRGTTAFSNPAGTAILVTASTTNGNVANTTDRVDSDWQTQAGASQWWNVDIGSGRRFIPSHMRFRQRVGTGLNLLRSFVVAGSNDGAAWTGLVTVNVGDPNLVVSQAAWSTIPLVSAGIGFQYFRVTMTGTDSSGNTALTISELELFGELI